MCRYFFVPLSRAKLHDLYDIRCSECLPYIRSSCIDTPMPLWCTVAQNYIILIVHWEVNEWSDRLIDLRCLNGSSPGEKVSSYSLFYNQWLIPTLICLCFLWDHILPSSHNSFKSHRLIKVIDWLLGVLLFPSVYLPVLEHIGVCTSVMVTRSLSFFRWKFYTTYVTVM